MNKSIDLQYSNTCIDVLCNGTRIPNERTGIDCITGINYDFIYNTLPLLTLKKVFIKSAIAEVLGYIRGYTSAKDFRDLGTKTWDANANENKAWLENIHRKGVDDMGYVYGAIGRGWRKHGNNENDPTIDQLAKIINNLKRGVDDRGEILTYWNPGEFENGCLRPCMHSYQFSLLGDTLHLNVTQRSADMPLGK